MTKPVIDLDKHGFSEKALYALLLIEAALLLIVLFLLGYVKFSHLPSSPHG